MIISVDTGNKHMKTENCEFNSGVEILDSIFTDNISCPLPYLYKKSRFLLAIK